MERVAATGDLPMLDTKGVNNVGSDSARPNLNGSRNEMENKLMHEAKNPIETNKSAQETKLDYGNRKMYRDKKWRPPRTYLTPNHSGKCPTPRQNPAGTNTKGEHELRPKYPLQTRMECPRT